MSYAKFPEIHYQIKGMEDIRLPRMVRIRQLYDRRRIEDLAGWTRRELEEKLSAQLKGSLSGKRICITAGSRGIPHIVLILRTVVDWLKEKGARPFVIPAMGSHGGGTAEGQKDYLAGFGVTEEALGAPVISSMEVVQLDQMEDGTPVYCDRQAYESDGIIIFNKVKPHTDFRGKWESGLAKMCAIGISKHQGASYFHMKGFPSFARRVPEVARILIDRAPVIFGLGVVQNAYDEISELEVMPRERIMERDAALLEIAKAKIASFKMHSMDVLIIDRIGKNISGNGHDPNITGRSNSKGFEDVLDCKKLFIRGLTEQTHNNACGLSAADITTRRVMEQVDLGVTYTNVVTATMLNGAALPMYANNDREAILICIRTCNGIDFDRARVVRIGSTAEMEEIQVSESLLDELRGRDDVEILGEPEEMAFDAEGNLTD